MTAAVPGLCEQPPEVVEAAPWPIVWECHSGRKTGHTCPQSDGAHTHQWIAWKNPDPIVLHVSGPGIPVRCKTCGGRKCDTPTCLLRRHHGGDHEHY